MLRLQMQVVFCNLTFLLIVLIQEGKTMKAIKKFLSLLGAVALSYSLPLAVASAAEAAPYCYGESTDYYAITYVVGCEARHHVSGMYRGNPSQIIDSKGDWALWGIQSNAYLGEIVLVTSNWGEYRPA